MSRHRSWEGSGSKGMGEHLLSKMRTTLGPLVLFVDFAFSLNSGSFMASDPLVLPELETGNRVETTVNSLFPALCMTFSQTTVKKQSLFLACYPDLNNFTARNRGDVSSIETVVHCVLCVCTAW